MIYTVCKHFCFLWTNYFPFQRIVKKGKWVFVQYKINLFDEHHLYIQQAKQVANYLTS